MQPWLSSGVLRYAIVLSFGWISLAVVVAATSGVIAGDPAADPSSPSPGRAVRFDQADPCTHDPIALEARLFVSHTARVDVDVIHTDALVTLNGWVQAGANRTERRLAIVDHFGFTRTLLMGLLAPLDALVRLVERPSLQDTLLSVRLQPFWDGSRETIAVADARLICEGGS